VGDKPRPIEDKILVSASDEILPEPPTYSKSEVGTGQHEEAEGLSLGPKAGILLSISGVSLIRWRPDERAVSLAERRHDDHLLFIEFRPNDLASSRRARLTDDLPPRISNKLVAI
jgi:hypothetical protein